MEENEVGPVKEVLSVGVEPVPAFIGLDGEQRMASARYEVFRVVGADLSEIDSSTAALWMNQIARWLSEGVLPEKTNIATFPHRNGNPPPRNY